MPSSHRPGDIPERTFRVRTRRMDSNFRVLVEGRLDGRSGHHLVDVLDQMVIAGDRVTIDLTSVSHMDDEGLEALAQSTRVVMSLGASVSLRVTDDHISDALTRHGLDEKSTSSANRSAPALAEQRIPPR